MARNFVAASSHRITLGVAGAEMLYGTVAAILRRASNGANHRVVQTTNGGTSQYGITLTSGDKLGFRIGAATVDAPTITVTASDGWVFLAITKATGTVKQRYHKYVYSSNTWTHEDASATQADSSTATHTSCTIGHSNSATYFDGDIEAGGFWLRNMTDQEVESLAYGLMPWVSLDPTALWLLDQDSTSQLVLDLSGHGANQTAINGTTVSTGSVPVFSYGAPVLLVNRSPTATFSGDAAFTSTAVLGPATPLLQAQGSAAFTSTGQLGPVGLLQAQGSAALTSTGALGGATAQMVTSTTAPLTSNATLGPADATIAKVSSGGFTSQGTLGPATATVQAAGQGPLTSQAAITTTQVLLAIGAAPLTSTGQLGPSGLQLGQGQAPITSTGQLGPSGLQVAPTTAPLTSQAVLVATGAVLRLGDGALTSVGHLGPGDATLLALADATLTSVGNLAGVVDQSSGHSLTVKAWTDADPLLELDGVI